ncbi:dermonecrotic toxin Hl-PLD1-like [Haemaphysalis longicornis]
MAFVKATAQRFCHVVAFLTLLHMTLLPTEVESQRPFYIIGNMVNSLYDVNVFLEDGANALQADVTFSPNGRAQHTYHGPPCDCYRSCTRDSTIKDYLNKLRRETSKGRRPCHPSHAYHIVPATFIGDFLMGTIEQHVYGSCERAQKSDTNSSMCLSQPYMVTTLQRGVVAHLTS